MSKPTTVAVATYKDRDSAVKDYEAVREAKHHGQFDHLAIAVVEKDADGKLKIDRHNTSAKHLAWGGAIVGATLAVLVPPVGITTLAGVAASGGVLAGAGGIIGHLHRNIPKSTVDQMNELIESGNAGLVVVAVNPKGSDLGELLAGAEKKIVTDNIEGNGKEADDALDKAFEAADAEEAA
ncbi:MAG: hypothetical protein ACTHON_05785 [Humibacter sp.]